MDYKKIIRIVYYLAVTALVGFILYWIFKGEALKDMEEVAVQEEGLALRDKGADFGVWLGVILTAVATVASLGLALMGIISKPKSAIWSVGGVAGLAILFFIGKSMAGDKVPAQFQDTVTLETVQLSEAGIWIATILAAITVLMVIASGVKSLFD